MTIKRGLLIITLMIALLALAAPAFAQEGDEPGELPPVELNPELEAENEAAAGLDEDAEDLEAVAGVAEEEGEVANGASLLIFLIGIAAVAIVGGGSLLREQFQRRGNVGVYENPDLERHPPDNLGA